MLTHFDVDAVQDLPLIPLAMDPPQLMQALHLLFKHSTAGCMCKEEGKSCCSHPWSPLQRQQIAAESGWKITLGDVTCWSCFLRERSYTEICRNFHHTLSLLPTSVIRTGGQTRAGRHQVISVVCSLVDDTTSRSVLEKRDQQPFLQSSLCTDTSCAAHTCNTFWKGDDASLLHSLRLCICPDALK